jgi:hypothetical protein
MGVWAEGLAIDFGTIMGLFTYDGSNWKRLSTWDAEGMEAVDLY